MNPEKEEETRKLARSIGEEYSKDKPEDLPSPRWEELRRLCKSLIVAEYRVEEVRKSFKQYDCEEMPEYHLVELAIEHVLREGAEAGDVFLEQEALMVLAWEVGLVLMGAAAYFFSAFLWQIFAGGTLTLASTSLTFAVFTRQLRLKKYRWIWCTPFFTIGCIISFLTHGVFLFLKN